MIRPRNKKAMLLALAKTNQPIAVLRRLIIKIGRRPSQSDSDPRSGADKKANNEKTENIIVISSGDMPKLWA